MLKIQDLSVQYGTCRVVENVSLDVAPGEVVALIGPNGAGKTSLVRGVSGVTKIKSGSIHFGDTDLLSLNAVERARILAVVPQVSYVGGAYTVEQVVMMGRTAYMSWIGRPSNKDEEIVRIAMESTNTSLLTERRIAELSGGEQQRVMLARALAQNTPLLVMDEPTNHLDLQHQGTVLSLVREQVAQQNLAVLMVLHDLNLVSQFADKVALMTDGKVIDYGRPAEVLKAETISRVYQAQIEVILHPETSQPIILHKTGGQSGGMNAGH
jgi:iron complex transport system ATP-binding protein